MSEFEKKKIKSSYKKAFLFFIMTILSVIGMIVSTKYYAAKKAPSSFGVLVAISMVTFLIGLFATVGYMSAASGFKRIIKGVNLFSDKHQGNVSKLYFYSKKGNQDITDVVYGVDEERPVVGIDEYGIFHCVSDKEKSAEYEHMIITPSYIAIRASFFNYKILSADDYPLCPLDFIFMYPNSKYLLIFNEKYSSFVVLQNWSGIVDTEEINKTLEQMNKLRELADG